MQRFFLIIRDQEMDILYLSWKRYLAISSMFSDISSKVKDNSGYSPDAFGKKS